MDNNTFIPPVVNQKKSGLPNLSGKIIMIIVGLALALIIAIGLMMISSSSNPTDKLDQLNARMSSLKAVVDVGKKHAQSSDLKKTVSDASILLVNDTKLVSEVTATAGATSGSAAAGNAELIEQLESAARDGRFDAVYIPELISQYESMMILLNNVNNSTNSPVINAAIKSTYSNCESVVEQLQSLTT